MNINILLLSVPSTAILLLMILHSFFKRGKRLTLTFFLSAFIFGIVRGNLVYFVTNGNMPYIFFNPMLRIGGADLMMVIGFTYALYFSWNLAESLTNKHKSLKRKVFPTLAISCLFMEFTSFSLELTADKVGWWHWAESLLEWSLFDFLKIGPFICAWISVGFDFLIAFFLIECSKFKKKKWRFLFILLLPLDIFIHYLALYYGIPIIIIIWHWTKWSSVLIMPFVFHTTFEYPKQTKIKGFNRLKELGLIKNAPLYAVAVMLSIVYIMDIFFAKMPVLVLTTIPLIILTWLAR